MKLYALLLLSSVAAAYASEPLCAENITLENCRLCMESGTPKEMIIEALKNRLATEELTEEIKARICECIAALETRVEETTEAQ